MNGPDDSGCFQIKTVLASGTYEYKYVLEGTRWRQDPSNTSHGGGYYRNSILEVGKAPRD
jgi:hypothetical protein